MSFSKEDLPLLKNRVALALEDFMYIMYCEGFSTYNYQAVDGLKFCCEQDSLIRGYARIDVSGVYDKIHESDEIFCGIKIDLLKSQYRATNIGLRTIYVLYILCHCYKVDLCLWCSKNTKLENWYKKIGFVEKYINSKDEKLLVLDNINKDYVKKRLDIKTLGELDCMILDYQKKLLKENRS